MPFSASRLLGREKSTVALLYILQAQLFLPAGMSSIRTHSIRHRMQVCHMLSTHDCTAAGTQAKGWPEDLRPSPPTQCWAAHACAAQ